MCRTGALISFHQFNFYPPFLSFPVWHLSHAKTNGTKFPFGKGIISNNGSLIMIKSLTDRIWNNAAAAAIPSGIECRIEWRWYKTMHECATNGNNIVYASRTYERAAPLWCDILTGVSSGHAKLMMNAMGVGVCQPANSANKEQKSVSRAKSMYGGPSARHQIFARFWFIWRAIRSFFFGSESTNADFGSTQLARVPRVYLYAKSIIWFGRETMESGKRQQQQKKKTKIIMK